MSCTNTENKPLAPEIVSNGIHYTLHGDYYFPDIIFPELADSRPIGKWGRLRMNYLQNHRPVIYNSLMVTGKLHTHLADLEEQAQEQHERMVKQMAQSEGITEALKAADQMEWVRRMNMVSHTADEIIMSELIYV